MLNACFRIKGRFSSSSSASIDNKKIFLWHFNFNKFGLWFRIAWLAFWSGERARICTRALSSEWSLWNWSALCVLYFRVRKKVFFNFRVANGDVSAHLKFSTRFFFSWKTLCQCKHFLKTFSVLEECFSNANDSEIKLYRRTSLQTSLEGRCREILSRDMFSQSSRAEQAGQTMERVIEVASHCWLAISVGHKRNL